MITPNGVDINYFSDNSKEYHFDFVSMCRLKNHKRVDLLIEATRRIIDTTGKTDIKVAIIGTGPEKEKLINLDKGMSSSSRHATHVGRINTHATKFFELWRRPQGLEIYITRTCNVPCNGPLDGTRQNAVPSPFVHGLYTGTHMYRMRCCFTSRELFEQRMALFRQMAAYFTRKDKKREVRLLHIELRIRPSFVQTSPVKSGPCFVLRTMLRDTFC